MMTETSVHRHRLPSKIESLVDVEKIVDELKETFLIPEEIYGNILVSLSEATNNAIKHGNKLDPEKYITLSFLPDKDKFTFSVIDEGNGFDYSDIPDPTHPDNIDKPDGRGIFIMKNLADDVEFIDEGKEVRLIFNR